MKYSFEELKKIANDYDLRLAGNSFDFGYDLWYKNKLIVVVRKLSKYVYNGPDEKHEVIGREYGFSYSAKSSKKILSPQKICQVITKHDVLNFIENQKNVIDKCFKYLYIEERKNNLVKDFD